MARPHSEDSKRILQFIAQAAAPVGAEELAKHLSIKPLKKAQNALSSLSRHGHIVRIEMGKYSAAPEGSAPPLQKAKPVADAPAGFDTFKAVVACAKILKRLQPAERTMALEFLRETL